MNSLRPVLTDNSEAHEPAFDWYSHVETHMDAVIPEVFGVRTDGQSDGQPGLKARVERLEWVIIAFGILISGQWGAIFGLVWVAL